MQIYLLTLLMFYKLKNLTRKHGHIKCTLIILILNCQLSTQTYLTNLITVILDNNYKYYVFIADSVEVVTRLCSGMDFM